MDIHKLREKLGRKTIPVVSGTPVHAPSSGLASYIGYVSHKAPDENWPTRSNGEPMMPLVQLYLNEIEVVPEALKDLSLITVFIDPDPEPGLRNGEGWCLRAYSDVSVLQHEPCPEVIGPAIPHKRLSWGAPLVDMPPSPDYVDEKFYEDLQEYYGSVEHDEICSHALKVGGYPRHLQWEIHFCETRPNEDEMKEYGFSIMDIRIPNPAAPAFAFQVASMHELEFYIGDMGIIYFGRGTGDHQGEWFLQNGSH